MPDQPRADDVELQVVAALAGWLASRHAPAKSGDMDWATVRAELRAAVDEAKDLIEVQYSELRGHAGVFLDEAILDVIAEHTGITSRDLRAAVRARLGKASNNDIARRVERLVALGRVRREEGAGLPTPHYLVDGGGPTGA